jgi:hypothetical protein
VSISEPPLPVPEDDALDAAASAVVDGVATPEEAAAVAAAPDGAARVAAQRAVADAVRSPVGAQDSRAAATALSAALAAFDLEGDDGAGTAEGTVGGRAPAPVSRLPQAPPGSRSRGGLPRLAAVAAALVLLLGVGALLVGALSPEQDAATTFSAAPPAKEAAESLAADAGTAAGGASPGVASGAAAPNAAGATTVAPAGPAAGAPGRSLDALAPTSSSPPPPVVDGGDLGNQEEVEALAQRAAAALDGVPDPVVARAEAALPTEVQACVNAAAANANEVVGGLRYRAVGSFQGVPAVFLAFDRPGAQPPRLLLVLARTGCDALASSHF